MDNNRIKINYNSSDKTASFQFMSDNGCWTEVHKGSALSRKKYLSAIAENRIDDLINIINETYNVGECGVFISFIGDETAFKKIRSCVQKYDGIEIERKEIKSIISGKRNAGKTCLIEGIFNMFDKQPRIDDSESYVMYSDDDS